MAQFEVIEDIEKNLQYEERIYSDLEVFNKERKSNSNLILHVNIRSLNANFNKLQILIKSLKIKPFVIVCSEVWELKHYQYYKIEDYNIYYNNANINQNDGVVIYIKKDVVHTTETIEIVEKDLTT